VRFSGKRRLAFTRQDLDQRVLRGGVFGKFLAFGETKKYDPARAGVQNSPAYNSVCRKLCFVIHGEDF